jgi:RHS repeat-associated protein
MSDINNYRHFAYDTLGRLISFWESNGRDGTPVRKIDWIYDIYGNILSKTTYGSSCPPEGCVETHTVDAANNRITGWSQTPQYEGPYTYTYDAAGNRLGSGRTYDAENRLTGYTGISFQYDGNSHRFRRVAGGTTTYYVYSARGFLLLEDNVTGGVVNNQIYFNGSLIATHDQNDCVRFYIKDHLGSTRSIVTVTPGTPWGYNWQTTAAFSYNPFGDFNSSWNNDPQSSRVRFTGKEREDNGLDYFGARYYDSKRTYRWMSPDPITTRVYDPLSLNKYSYVRNDPVNLTDPDGRSPVEFHQAFTSLLATAFGLSAEDSADLVRGAVDADDFVHGSTGLFLIGGFLLILSGTLALRRNLKATGMLLVVMASTI